MFRRSLTGSCAALRRTSRDRLHRRRKRRLGVPDRPMVGPGPRRLERRQGPALDLDRARQELQVPLPRREVGRVEDDEFDRVERTVCSYARLQTVVARLAHGRAWPRGRLTWRGLAAAARAAEAGVVLSLPPSQAPVRATRRDQRGDEGFDGDGEK
jgi:hypothetical protein